MRPRKRHFIQSAGCLVLTLILPAMAQQPGAEPPPPGGPGGPPPFGFGGPGRGGPGGGPMAAEVKLVKRFDGNGDGWLNVTERKAAREALKAEGDGVDGGRRGPFGGRGEESGPVAAGPRIAPEEVKTFADRSPYDMETLRTLFLEFEGADWEKELAEFKNTDVEVPARLTVDGRVFNQVGVHFRGMSSFGMVGEGRKRSFNLSLDAVRKDQQWGDYRTLNLLNSHEDPSFLRAVLYLQIARDYLPAPKANFVRVVINGESWGVYANVQQFNKDFVKDWFETTKGARWKVTGSPRGGGSLAYLGDDPGPYQRLYEIKTKDDAKSWADLIRLCRVLNETPAEKLEEALTPLLDIDGALKFLAVENALINNDGYWIRASDYNLYQDEKGRFHVLPHDANETFALPGGPGFGGGPGGPGGFGPGMFLAPQFLEQGDKDRNGNLSKAEFSDLAAAWWDKLDAPKAGKLNAEQFTASLAQVLPPPPGFGPGGGAGSGPGERRGGFGPAMFVGPGMFAALDADKDDSLSRQEFLDAFAKWAGDWDPGRTGFVTEEKLREGLNSLLAQPGFGGPRMAGGPGGPGGAGGDRGPGGPGGARSRGGSNSGGGPRINGVELDPLFAASDDSKPLISKLLAVPAFRARYLACIRDIAEKWLDWNRLGPLVEQYHALIADDVRSDTHKLGTTEAFEKSLSRSEAVGAEPRPSGGGRGFGRREPISLRDFAERRRAYLLSGKVAGTAN